MGSAAIYDTYRTSSGVQGVKYALGQALRQVGGTMSETPDGLWIVGGVQTVSMGFTAELTAHVSIRQTSPDQFDVMCALNWKPSAVVWICFVVGLFMLWMLWIVSGLYLIFNPTQVYQTALSQAHNYLPDATPQAQYSAGQPPVQGFPGTPVA